MCGKDKMKGTPQVIQCSPPLLLLLQAVLGALIAVNLKNSLKQLSDPYYLWRKSKLDCVSVGWSPVTHRCPCPPLSPQLWPDADALVLPSP